MADIEDNVPVGRLTGRFVVEVQDNADPDQKAQLVPATGEILVKASIGTLKITDPETGKFITFRGPHRAILDEDGYICTPYPGTDTIMYRDLVLWSNDSDMLDVQGWTYTATFNLKDKAGRQLTLGAINFELATDQVKDLVDAIPTSSSPGYGLGLAEQSALQAAQSAAEAQAIAQSVRDDADAGEFDGAPGNATMRIDTTVGERIYLAAGSTEKLISATTQWRDVSSLLTSSVVVNTPGRAALIRNNDRCTLLLSNVSFKPEATEDYFLRQYPIGFRPKTTTRVPAYMMSSGANSLLTGVTIRQFERDIRIGSRTQTPNFADQYSQVEITWLTVDAWPTASALSTLPVIVM